MKKQISLIILSLASVLLLASCDSGNTQANASTPGLGGDRIQEEYTGSVTFTGGPSSAVTLNLQGNGDSLQGNIIFDNGRCLCDTLITGTQSGFNMRLDSGSCTAEYIPLFCDDDAKNDDGTCTTQTATGSASYLISGTDANLSGSFTVSGDICQDASRLQNSGTIELKRK